MYFCANIRPMKNRIFIVLAALGLCLTSCQDPAKSRLYMDNGVKLMINYSKFGEAEKAFDKAIRYDRNNAEAYYYRGCLKVNTKKYHEAIADFEKATELKPDYADAYFNMGKTYFLLNDEESACNYYKLAEKYGRPNLEDYLRRCR